MPLYSGIDEFRLVDVDGVVLSNPNDFIVIREPEGWDSLNIVLERNGRGGFDFEYGDEESNLGFDGFLSSSLATQLTENTGRYLINDIFNIAGTDLNVKLEYFTDRFDSGNTPLYEGFIVGSSFDETDYATFFRVKRFDFENKLKTRFESVINVESNENLDAGAITPLSMREFAFHSQVVRDIADRENNVRLFSDLDPPEDFLWNYGWISQSGQINSLGESGFWIPSFPIQNIGSIEEYFDYGNVSLGNTTAVVNDPTVTEIFGETPESVKFFYLKLRDLNSQIQINFDVDFDVEINDNIVSGSYSIDVDYNCYIVIENPDNTIVQSIIVNSSTQNYNESDEGSVFNISIQGLFNSTLTRDQKVYFYIEFVADGTVTNPNPTVLGFSVRIKNINKSTFSVISDSLQNPTLVEAAYFNETLDKALESATGLSNILESSLFQNRPVNGVVDDCGGLNIVPTGFKIRQRNQPLRVSISDLLSFAEARYGCGYAIYYDNGNPKFLLERDEFFFQNKKIITLTNLHNPVIRTINKEILANELNVGFTKFARPNESGTSEGFSTQSQYLTPIQKDEKTLDFLSRLIGDSTEIERVRRNGIESSSDESDEKDDDSFVIKIHEFGDTEFYDPALYGNGEFLNIQRDATNARIIINGLIINDVQENDFININGATNRQIDGLPVLDFENNRTILPCSTETQDDIIFNEFNFRQSDNSTTRYTYSPERLEGFSNVTGLIDERTVYNMDHANTQFLFWNFGWFGGSLAKKDGLSTFVKFLTKKAITTLQKNYDLLTCGLTSSSINERADFLVASLRGYNLPIFNEFVYEVTAQLSFNDLLIIKQALRNVSPQDINYGFIEFTDNFGNSVEAFPMKIEYNPISLKTTFVLWGKSD